MGITRVVRYSKIDDIEELTQNKSISSSPFIVVVENFLSSSELRSLLDSYAKVRAKANTLPNEQGLVYPLSIYAYQYKFRETQDIIGQKSFFDSCVNFNKAFKDVFIVDIQEKLSNLFAKLLLADRFDRVKHSSFGGEFPFCTFRELFPQTGEMTIHCEKALMSFAEDFYANFRVGADASEQLSYFITLQKPDRGGELLLYDFDYEKVSRKLRDNEFLMADGTVLNIDESSERCTKIDPSAGSIVVFNGGNFWHKIDKVEGCTERITLGGFAITTTDFDKAVFVWS